MILICNRKKKVLSLKRQAALDNGSRIVQDKYRKKKYMNDVNLKRIADAMEEILRLVKKDQEESKKRWDYKPEEKDE